MKQITNILFLTILCVLFISCGESLVDMSNVQFQLSKSTYKVKEDIDIEVIGNFLSQECVVGGFFSIYVCKSNIIEDSDEELKFEITKIDGNPADLNNKFYKEYLSYNSSLYRYEIIPKENEKYITNFNTSVTISLAEPAAYNLAYYCEVESSKRKLGGVVIEKLPFIVTE